MYFNLDTNGDVKTIVCALSGKRWDYVKTSIYARMTAERNAVGYQKTLIKALMEHADLHSRFYTFGQLEYAYEKYRRACANEN